MNIYCFFKVLVRGLFFFRMNFKNLLNIKLVGVFFGWILLFRKNIFKEVNKKKMIDVVRIELLYIFIFNKLFLLCLLLVKFFGNYIYKVNFVCILRKYKWYLYLVLFIFVIFIFENKIFYFFFMKFFVFLNIFFRK